MQLASGRAARMGAASGLKALGARHHSLLAPRRPAPRPRRTSAAAVNEEVKATDKRAKQVQEYVEALQKGGVDEEVARAVIQKWRDAGGADGDPSTLRRLFLKQSSIPLLATGIQTLVDAAAAYSIFTSGVLLAAGPEFYGRDVLVLLLNFLAGYFAVGVALDIATLTTIAITTAKVGTSIDAFYGALKTIAGPSGGGSTGLAVLDKAAAAANAVKVAQALDAIQKMLDGAPGAGPGGDKGGALASLSAYLTLYRSEQRDGFDPRKLGMTEAEASDLAAKFAQFDLNDDGRLDAPEVRSMAAQLGIELSEAEAAAAIQAMDRNSDGLVEFSEWAGWWSGRRSKQ